MKTWGMLFCISIALSLPGLGKINKESEFLTGEVKNGIVSDGVPFESRNRTDILTDDHPIDSPLAQYKGTVENRRAIGTISDGEGARGADQVPPSINSEFYQTAGITDDSLPLENGTVSDVGQDKEESLRSLIIKPEVHLFAKAEDMRPYTLEGTISDEKTFDWRKTLRDEDFENEPNDLALDCNDGPTIGPAQLCAFQREGAMLAFGMVSPEPWEEFSILRAKPTGRVVLAAAANGTLKGKGVVLDKQPARAKEFSSPDGDYGIAI